MFLSKIEAAEQKALAEVKKDEEEVQQLKAAIQKDEEEASKALTKAEKLAKIKEAKVSRTNGTDCSCLL